MTNLIVLSYVLFTNPPQSLVVGTTPDGFAVVPYLQTVEARTVIGFKRGKEVVTVGETSRIVETKQWTNMVRIAGWQPQVAQTAPTNTPSRGQLMRQQRERERTNTVSKPATNAPSRGQLLRQQREFERTNTAKAKPDRR